MSVNEAVPDQDQAEYPNGSRVPGVTAEYIDIDGRYGMLYRNTERRASLVMLDFYVFGSVTKMEDLPS